MGITRKIALVAAVIGVLSGCVFGLFSVFIEGGQVIGSARRNSDLIIRATLPQVSGAYWEVDVSEVRAILSGLLEDPSISRAQIDDPLLTDAQRARSGLKDLSAEIANPASPRPVIAALYSPGQLSDRLEYPLTSPRDGSEIGQLIVDLSFAPALNAMLGRSAVVLGLSILQALLVTGAIFLAIQWAVIRPIARLQAAALRVRDGHKFELTKRDARMLDESRRDEISRLARAFRRTVTALEASRENLQTQVNERTRELLDARNEAVEASKVKSAFLANMSHEFRTPLNAITGLTELLMREGGAHHTGHHTGQHLHDMREAAHFLSANIEAVLDISKIEAGQIELEESWTDLSVLLDSILGQARGLLWEKPLRLDWAYDADLPARILVDPLRLTRIVMNFVSNAVKFTQSGGISFEVRRAGRGGIAFTVRDTGPGIPPDQIEDIFKPFTQAGNAATRRAGGTGLGLAIARRLADQMAGRIDVASTPGDGAAFTLTVTPETGDASKGKDGALVWITGTNALSDQIRGLCSRIGLPLAAAPDAAALHLSAARNTLDITTRDGRSRSLALPVTHRDVLDTATRLLNPADTAGDSGQELAGRRVLVVEDNRINRSVFRSLIGAMAAQTRTARHGAEALDMVAGDMPDVIVMDLQMPVLDGHRAMEILRQTYGGALAPVIATSANSTPNQIARCKAEGFAGFLSKPVDPDTLRQMLLDSAQRTGLPVLDRARGLALCGGDTALYHKTLAAFRDALPGWLDACTAPAMGDTARGQLLHDLKGSASTIGAQALTQAIKLAETDPARMGLVTAELKRLAPLMPAQGQVVPTVVPIGDARLCEICLHDLDMLIKSNDMAATRLVDRLVAEAAQPEHARVLADLQTALHRLDFKQAHPLLRALRNLVQPD